MTIPFHIQVRGDRYVPAHHGYEHIVSHGINDGESMEDIRRQMFDVINAEDMHPGVFHFDKSLQELRDEAFSRIDARSDGLIASGFPFEGSVFSLSVEAQVRYSTMLMLAAALPYPLTINSLDDRTSVDLLSEQHTQAFCMTAMGYVKGVVDSGSVQKSLVREMTDTAELTVYQDPR